MLEATKKLVRLDYTNEYTMSTLSAKLVAGWTALFAGISLGDISTLAVIIWTCLNILFLLYDRLIKPHRKIKPIEVKDTDLDPQFKDKE